MLTRTPAEILRRVHKIEIHSRSKVSEAFSGEYHSSFKGQGLEFSELREYQSGDNYRNIDWNVSARLGTPYVKLFTETRELNVVFLVDVSASLGFGTKVMLKKEKQAELVALLAFSALSNNDKVGMIMFSSALEKYLPPRKGRNRALQMLRDILYYEPQDQRTNLAAAFEYANLILKKRSIIFVLSDFADQGFVDSLAILAGRHDVVALQILDQAELALPKAGILNLYDPETGFTMYVNSSDPFLRRNYKAYMENMQKNLNKELIKAKVDHLCFCGSDEVSPILREFFQKRKRIRNIR